MDATRVIQTLVYAINNSLIHGCDPWSFTELSECLFWRQWQCLKWSWTLQKRLWRMTGRTIKRTKESGRWAREQRGGAYTDGEATMGPQAVHGIHNQQESDRPGGRVDHTVHGGPIR